ncbi:MAG: hypothetical protein AAF383_17505 [Cyanobacteria bacterium P01_A01_bin.83]
MNFLNFLFGKHKQVGQVCDYHQFVRRKQLAYQLRAKLISLVDGNWKQADELIARARFADPGKSDSYYHYKAIINLEKRKDK